MANQYSLTLSRKDMALASYCPGLEIKNRPTSNWIEKALLPAIRPAVNTVEKRLSNIPVTFWISIRETARPFGQEIFLFTTPYRLNVPLRKTIARALEVIEDANVFASGEPIPDDAMPCCQIFRRKLIRFYFRTDNIEDCYVPVIGWNRWPSMPTINIREIDQRATFLQNQDGEDLLIRGVVDEVMNGDFYRQFQQALSTIGVSED
ncbi:MAG: hypothetical protein Q8P44_02005 [Dehalococcoidia bacterium]|nr:hypothetical protein [Dehalococcoidia bacterium]